MTTPTGYALLDSGQGEKLERLGPKTLVRPCSVALWNRRNAKIWDGAAQYSPKIQWRGAPNEPWRATVGSLQCLVRCQNNGQIGLFPEHLSYFPWLKSITEGVASMRARPARVLNLFAYTGLASVLCAKSGAEVTHVDNAKAVLSWARENANINQIPSDRVRLLCEDASAFIEREIRRGNHYDLIIADPPSFSRPTKGKSWNLEDVIVPLIRSMVTLFDPAGGALVLCSHHQALTAPVLRNILLDWVEAEASAVPLEIREHAGARCIPCGSALFALSGTMRERSLPSLNILEENPAF